MAKLKQGDTIRGYELVEDFRMANGANCEWTFAEKGGEHFFVKAFLSPKYPLDGAPGSPETIAKKRDVCAAFEAHQRKLLKSATKVAGAGGKLVVPVEFFREGTLFYKVARRIDAVTMDVDHIARLALDEKLAMMAATVAAIYALHNAGIVHGDLKPANILISRTAKDSFNANVIDFDSSYISAEPPSPEWLTGDPPFYSPELLSYIKGDSAHGTTLTLKSDIFALGLVFWQFLIGGGPRLPPDCHYACEAAEAGHRLTMPPTVRHDVAEMIEQMVSFDPDSRPTIARVQATIRALRRAAPVAVAPDRLPTTLPEPMVPADPSRPAGRLKITTKHRTPTEMSSPLEPDVTPAASAPEPLASRVRYKNKAT